MSNSKIPFPREQAGLLSKRLEEPRRFLQVVTGSRQAGKTTLVNQVTQDQPLPGRFETTHLPHWSLVEMEAAFGYHLEDYLYFGGYPGAAPLRDDPVRWRSYPMDQ